MEFEYKKITADLHSQYPLNLRKTLTITLALFIILVFMSPRIEFAEDDFQSPIILIDVEDIPVTRQLRRMSPPPKPTVPVPSEKETIPEELTIEETTLKYTNFFDNTPDWEGLTSTVLVPPKPIAWVFPKYPREDKDRGIHGVVKLSIHVDETGRVIDVIVLDNSTGSPRCAQAAVSAAYGSRFIPAREGRKAVNFWITQPYTFDLRD